MRHARPFSALKGFNPRNCISTTRFGAISQHRSPTFASALQYPYLLTLYLDYLAETTTVLVAEEETTIAPTTITVGRVVMAGATTTRMGLTTSPVDNMAAVEVQGATTILTDRVGAMTRMGQEVETTTRTRTGLATREEVTPVRVVHTAATITTTHTVRPGTRAATTTTRTGQVTTLPVASPGDMGAQGTTLTHTAPPAIRTLVTSKVRVKAATATSTRVLNSPLKKRDITLIQIRRARLAKASKVD
ncbi:hypothetical protein PILCRDRAFT_309525 [Piloderma croceum F 1598]|uniref:Uncharacterized protein n=1 Tax=Piloderma croceum (strain F 1598) TaxID=765440 RepID=A0A0C3FRS5_PILCF|nr:hypothetical protein PILCRDRAFT_309525 [Piloderma croceum F 1598]